MIYCTNCGSENYDDSRFCSHCGFAIEKGPLPLKKVVFASKEELADRSARFDPPSPSSTSNSTTTYVVREEHSGLNSKWIGIFLICAGFFLMIILLLPIFLMGYIGDYSFFDELGKTFGSIGGDFGNFFGGLGNKIGQFFGGLGNKIGQFFGTIGQSIGEVFDGFGDDFDVNVHHSHEYSSNTHWIIIGLLFRLFFIGIILAIAITIIMKTRARRVQTD